jgi:hypothetical protein
MENCTRSLKALVVGGKIREEERRLDRKLKENIIRVGDHPLGIGLYLFDYKSEFKDECGYGRRFGVMADEVEKVMSSAVITHRNGYQAVDYEMIGISFPESPNII